MKDAVGNGTLSGNRPLWSDHLPCRQPDSRRNQLRADLSATGLKGIKFGTVRWTRNNRHALSYNADVGTMRNICKVIKFCRGSRLAGS